MIRWVLTMRNGLLGPAGRPGHYSLNLPVPPVPLSSLLKNDRSVTQAESPQLGCSRQPAELRSRHTRPRLAQAALTRFTAKISFMIFSSYRPSFSQSTRVFPVWLWWFAVTARAGAGRRRALAGRMGGEGEGISVVYFNGYIGIFVTGNIVLYSGGELALLYTGRPEQSELTVSC